MWKSLSGKPIPDLVAAVQDLLRGDREVIHVGSDSQHYGQATHYVTVVAVVNPGAGGRVLYRKSSVPRAHSLAHKLFREAADRLTAPVGTKHYAGITIALEAIPRIKRMSDRTLLERMRLLAAEGLGRVGRAADGAQHRLQAPAQQRALRRGARGRGDGGAGGLGLDGVDLGGQNRVQPRAFVGAHGRLDDLGVVVVQHRTHALEILVDPHAHDLDLEPKLFGFGLERLPQGDPGLQPKRPVT